MVHTIECGTPQDKIFRFIESNFINLKWNFNWAGGDRFKFSIDESIPGAMVFTPQGGKFLPQDILAVMSLNDFKLLVNTALTTSVNLTIANQPITTLADLVNCFNWGDTNELPEAGEWVDIYQKALREGL